VFSFTRTGGTHPGDPLGTFDAFCIEPREFVSPGSTYTYNVGDLSLGATNIGGMGAAKADLLRELYGRFHPWFGSPLDLVTAGALQIATWEIVREDSGTLHTSTGTTRFRNPSSQAALDLAQTYLSAIDGTGPRLQNVLAGYWVGDQDIVFQTPEPVGLAAIGLGFLALAWRLRRKG
jgi:hypothetical protein